ncbi:hypothetical protein CLOSTMETH_01832 [[Clostridium] methylpentosum DSM 5476]|uniref:Uncharacterized protein n=1 Tax=[Clostridium] methylpentosum DSM 5476 TaxID=537013 RepID=C0EDA5_9FIRM|nr:hypothetical protein CLOSTMETH_01832 [[Clostridium] methylpentosum DSM 5476]
MLCKGETTVTSDARGGYALVQFLSSNMQKRFYCRGPCCGKSS